MQATVLRLQGGIDMPKSLTMLALALLLAGCATAKPTYGPDGRPAYAVECSGSALSWGLCYEKAGSICGKSGYSVVSKSGDKGMIATPSILTTTVSRSMLIECK